MSANRRVFLSRSAIAVGVALGTSPLSLLARAPRTPGSFAIGGADQQVLNFAATYGRDPFFVGGGVLGRANGIVSGPISLVVRTDNAAALARSLDAMPFQSVHAAGNTLSFQAGGAVYQLENLSSEDYGQRLARAQSRGGSSFAHDAARYPLAQRQVQDPLGSMTGGTAQLRRTASETSLPARVGQMLRGLIEAGRYSLVPDAEFDAFRKHTLSESPGTADETAAVASLLLGAIAPLSAGGQASRLAELATSPLASASFGRRSARGGAQTMARYQQLRPVASRLGVSSGALWLAALLGPTWQSSGVRPEAIAGDYLSDLQTRAALAEASQLFTNKTAISQ